MKTFCLIKSFSLLATGALLTASCVVRERVVYSAPPAPVTGEEVVVAGAPPPPLEDVYIAAPGPGFFWVRGCWAWHGRWIWEPGRWARPPHRGAVWLAPHYERRHGVNVYIGGRWN